MNVLFLNPNFPAEMPDFARGLSEVGANVLAVGDTPRAALSDKVRRSVAAYLAVPRLLDEDDLVRRVVAWLGHTKVDRVESTWEPLVLAAARLRQVLGVPGMSVDTVMGFRDKQLMKDRVAAAGLRVPHAARVRTMSEAVAAAQRFGFPLCVKPIAGAGSADTYRVDDASDLKLVLDAMQHVPEASVEEFVEGEEFTYDTLCIDGRPVFHQVAQYLPRPLVARTVHDISPIILTFRDLSAPRLQQGIELGQRVLSALGMGTGFTHMEWYRKADGEVVFGEIGCRPGGARLVDQMNFGSDIDLYREWARAVCWGDVQQVGPKKYCTAIVFKRARGRGTIRAVEGLGSFMARYGDFVAAEELLRPGQRRRNWKQMLLSDGFLIVRHPDAQSTHELARRVADEIVLHAG